MQATTTPTKLPSPLFGANEIDVGKKVVNLKCGVYHFAAITSKCAYKVTLNNAKKNEFILLMFRY